MVTERREDRKGLRTRCFKFGLLAPVAGADLVHEQMLLGHRYRNRLVELERARRDSYSDALTTDPKYAAIRGEVRELEEQYELQCAAIQESRSGSKRRLQEPEGVESAAVLKKELRDRRKMLKAAEADARKRPDVKEAIRESNDEFHEAGKAAYAEYAELGLAWGTRCSWNRVAKDQFRKGPPPRYRRWDGGSTIAVQLQSQGDRNGYGVEAIFGKDETESAARRLVQIDRTPTARRAGRAGMLRRAPTRKDIGVVRLRVGSAGRDPVWAEWPVVLHRDLPRGARVKWVRVKAHRVATKLSWSLHIEFELPRSWIKEPCGEGGAVALDLNWRRVARADDLEQVTLKVGSWTAEDGEGGNVLLNPNVSGQFEQADRNRGIRQTHFDEIKKALRPLLKAARLGEEHRERVETLSRWKSMNRLAGLAHWWRENRCPGDEVALAAMEAWRVRDKHLFEWKANARRKALERREHDYRNLAVTLARRYSVLIVENINLSTLAARHDPEAPDYEERSDKASSQRFQSAPSELRKAFIQAFEDRGAEVIKVPAGRSSREILERWRAENREAANSEGYLVARSAGSEVAALGRVLTARYSPPARVGSGGAG